MANSELNFETVCSSGTV